MHLRWSLAVSLDENVFADAMIYCTITPNRGGEREELLRFCISQLQRMSNGTYIPAFIMNDRPMSDQCDLVPKVKHAISLAKESYCEWAFIIESDDAYPDDYFQRYLPYMNNFDFIGDPYSIYYNIRNRRWTKIHHPGRASLFTTAFRLSALERFQWPADNYVFLDQPLWKYAKKFKCKFLSSGAIGIKGHGSGKTGGKGHRMNLKNDDLNLSFLRNNVQPEHFEFYSELMTRL